MVRWVLLKRNYVEEENIVHSESEHGPGGWKVPTDYFSCHQQSLAWTVSPYSWSQRPGVKM